MVPGAGFDPKAAGRAAAAGGVRGALRAAADVQRVPAYFAYLPQRAQVPGDRRPMKSCRTIAEDVDVRRRLGTLLALLLPLLVGLAYGGWWATRPGVAH